MPTLSPLAPGPIAIAVRPARPEEAPTLENLFQLYAHDFSELMDVALGDDGRFAGKSFAEYWVDPWRHALLITVSGKLAGFALVHGKSRLSGDPAIWDMAEFFVVRGHRRRGVGSAAATALFRRFAGRWEVRQTPSNAAATAFWRRVIREHTGGSFEEVTLDDERWKGPVQSFESSPGGPG